MEGKNSLKKIETESLITSPLIPELQRSTAEKKVDLSSKQLQSSFKPINALKQKQGLTTKSQTLFAYGTHLLSLRKPSEVKDYDKPENALNSFEQSNIASDVKKIGF